MKDGEQRVVADRTIMTKIRAKKCNSKISLPRTPWFITLILIGTTMVIQRIFGTLEQFVMEAGLALLDVPSRTQYMFQAHRWLGKIMEPGATMNIHHLHPHHPNERHILTQVQIRLNCLHYLRQQAVMEDSSRALCGTCLLGSITDPRMAHRPSPHSLTLQRTRFNANPLTNLKTMTINTQTLTPHPSLASWRKSYRQWILKMISQTPPCWIRWYYPP